MSTKSFMGVIGALIVVVLGLSAVGTILTSTQDTMTIPIAESASCEQAGGETTCQLTATATPWRGNASTMTATHDGGTPAPTLTASGDVVTISGLPGPTPTITIVWALNYETESQSIRDAPLAATVLPFVPVVFAVAVLALGAVIGLVAVRRPGE